VARPSTPNRAASRISLAAVLSVLLWVLPASAQSHSAERVGDALRLVLPATSLGVTLALEDHDGTGEFLVGFAVNTVVTEGLKRLIHKDRPDGSDDRSFPSGHTSTAFQAASFIHFRYGLRYAAPAYAGAIFAGYSRVRARKHFVEDALVGLAIGTLTSRLFTDRRTEDIRTAGGRMELGLRVNFGGGLATRIGAGLLRFIP